MSYSQEFQPAVAAGKVSDPELSEVSGLVRSKANKNMLWAVNDSGNDPELYLISDQGKTIHSFELDGAMNVDWEDIAINSDPRSGIPELYIGDIGDNFAIRDQINVIKVREPDLTDSEDSVITEFINYKFEYEDGARDAETLIVDPISAKLYIISKREENVRIYRAPELLVPDHVMQLTLKATLPFHNVTAGDISSNGDEILLKNYDAIFYWKRKKEEEVFETMLKPHESIRYDPEPQGESIAWSSEHTVFFTLSEKSRFKDQTLFFFERKK